MNNKFINKILYNSGDVFLPESIKRILAIDLIGTSNKTFYISGWSIIHFINGIIIGFLYLYFNYDMKFYSFKMVTIHTLWELWQVLIGMAKPYKLTCSSNLFDIIIDTIMFMCGTYIIRYIMK